MAPGLAHRPPGGCALPVPALPAGGPPAPAVSLQAHPRSPLCPVTLLSGPQAAAPPAPRPQRPGPRVPSTVTSGPLLTGPLLTGSEGRDPRGMPRGPGRQAGPCPGSTGRSQQRLSRQKSQAGPSQEAPGHWVPLTPSILALPVLRRAEGPPRSREGLPGATGSGEEGPATTRSTTT